MKNNPNTKYMLIGLVMLIWGLIIYKMVSGLSDDGMPVSQEVYKPLPRKNTDTAYALLADNYADPFFNEIEIEEDTISGNGSEMDVVSTVPPIYELPVTQTLVEPPPSIKYNGYIYNPLTKKRTALIIYNGQTMVVRLADKLDEKTKIVKINEDELVISFKGKRIVIFVGGS